MFIYDVNPILVQVKRKMSERGYELMKTEIYAKRKKLETTARILQDIFKETFEHTTISCTHDNEYMDIIIADTRDVNGCSVSAVKFVLDFLEKHQLHSFWISPYKEKQLQIEAYLADRWKQKMSVISKLLIKEALKDISVINDNLFIQGKIDFDSHMAISTALLKIWHEVKQKD
jgi:hypothetical protein